MKKLLLALGFVLSLASCKDNHSGRVYVNEAPNVVVTPQATNIGDNLNLQALGDLVKNSSTAPEIEQKLNESGSINNLDLDTDGNVDYIKVTEYGEGMQRGFSFTVELPNNEVQEVATIELEKGATNANMSIMGNEQIYGAGHHYQSSFGLSDMMIMHYLWSSHRPYYSPYHYGMYPSYYRPYRPMAYGAYSNRMSNTTRTTTITRTSRPMTSTSRIKSPNANRTSSFANKSAVSSRANSMVRPTTSQKSFQKTSAAASRPTTSGFGNRNTTRPTSSSFGSSSRSSSSRPSSSSYGSSSRSSGRSSSSFGSSSRSSSRSSGSSRSSSRRSDARFKDNVASLNNSLEKVLTLEGKTYFWKSNEFPKENFDKKHQIGFIAQDLEKVFPEVVNTREDGYKTVDYDLLVPVLVESIKELNAKVQKQDSIIHVMSENARLVN